MRIYNDNTLSTFVDTLSNNKNAIICCRTIGIGNNPRSITPFGAFIEFWGDHGGLYPIWNSLLNNERYLDTKKTREKRLFLQWWYKFVCNHRQW